jgi:plasmid stabilization system protein ParE
MRPDTVVHPEAEDDAYAQFVHYLHAGTPETAARWRDRVDEAIDRAADFPGTGAPLNDARPRLAGWRLMPVRGFPTFAVAFRPCDGGGVEVFYVVSLVSDYRRRL